MELDPAEMREFSFTTARAVRTLRERRGDVATTERVIGLTAQAISERFAAAARAAGVVEACRRTRTILPATCWPRSSSTGTR